MVFRPPVRGSRTPVQRRTMAAPAVDLQGEVKRFFSVDQLLKELFDIKTTLEGKLAEADMAIAHAHSIQKGDQGDPGYTPQRGVDYHDGESVDIEAVATLVLSQIPEPVPGKDANEAAMEARLIKKFPKHAEIVRSVLAAMPKQIPAVPIDHNEIAKAIIDNKLITVDHIEGIEQTKRALSNFAKGGYRHGAGITHLTGSNGVTVVKNPDGSYTVIGPGTSGLSVITVSGVIDDSNTTFTAPTTPAVLVINGAIYRSTGAAITWTYLAGTITLSAPVGTGGDIYALG